MKRGKKRAVILGVALCAAAFCAVGATSCASKEEESYHYSGQTVEYVQSQDGLQYVYNDDKTEFILYRLGNYPSAQLEIPETFEGLPVTGIATGAFKKDTQLEEVIIPDSVVSIGKNSFEACESLRKVKIGEGVTEIPNFAFKNCELLKDVTAGSKLTAIGNAAFYGCTRLSTLDFSQTALKTIDSTAFQGCDRLRSIVLPESLEEIGVYAFSGCSMLGSVTLPARAQKILANAFEKCVSLKEIVLPDGIEDLGASAFYGCEKLQKITLPASLKKVGKAVFDGCESLQEVHYGGTVAEWCDVFFYDFLSNPLTQAHDLYIGGERVTDLVLPEALTEVKQYAFAGCSLTSVTLPSNLKTIGTYAFRACNCLTSITLPETLTDIGTNAFYLCNKLVEVENLSDLNVVLKGEGYGKVAFYALNLYGKNGGESNLHQTADGYVFYEGNNAVYLVGYRGTESELVLPRDYEGKEYNLYVAAFYNDSRIFRVVFPEKLEEVGSRAFFSCRNLENVTLSQNTKTIGEYAFANCEKLQTVALPDGLESIERYAFYHTDALRAAHLPDSLTKLGDYAYAYSGVDNVVVGNGLQLIDTAAFGACYYLQTVTIGEKVNRISSAANKEAFRYCYRLAEVKNLSALNIKAQNLDNGYVGYYAKRVYSGKVEGDEESRFSGPDAAGYRFFTDKEGNCYLAGYSGEPTDITLPSDYEGKSYDILDYAFMNRTDLTNITLSQGVQTVGEGAVAYCDKITQITIPEGVTWLKKRAFYGCSSLEKIYLPKTLAAIGENAFFDCSALAEVYYAGTLDDWCRLTIENAAASPLGFGGTLYVKDGGNYVKVTDFTFSASLEKINNYAFYGCESLVKVTIPKTLKEIGKEAFGRTTLKEAEFESEEDAKTWLAGWRRFRTLSAYDLSGSPVSTAFLSNPSSAANLLKRIYNKYYWKNAS